MQDALRQGDEQHRVLGAATRSRYDWPIVGDGVPISAGICLAATMLFALAPAVLTSHVDVATTLRSHTSGVVGARGSNWIRSALVLLQISLSFVLLVGARFLAQQESETYQGTEMIDI